jgi:cytochrome P450
VVTLGELKMAKQDAVFDFDHHSPEYAKNAADIYKDMRDKCPVGWTEKYGGFWVVSRYEDVAKVSHDDATFSSRHDIPPAGTAFSGITIPSGPTRSTPIEMDPPEFFKYRRMLNRRFAPEAIEALKPKMVEFTDYCIDRHIESGTIDLVLDLASPVPAMMTLEFMGVPVDEWEKYAEPMHAMIYTPPNSPEHEKVRQGLGSLHRKIAATIADRKARPRDDFISYLTQSQIEGRPISEEQLLEILNLVVAGGVDTTTSLIANSLEYLDRHPDLRQKLLDDPDLMLSAMEEFLRYFTPVQALARTATKDVELGGQEVKKGERILMCWAGANHDPEAFEHPEEVILDRFPNRHTAFGLGIHRCIGSNFARAEFLIVLERVLRRMTDYRIIRNAIVKYETIGVVNGYVKMPATFTPGRRVGATVATK